MRYSKREKDGRGGGHIERVKKTAALSADSVWFWFTCPPHYTKLKPARGRLEGATGLVLLHIQCDPSTKQTNKIGFCTLTYCLPFKTETANMVLEKARMRRGHEGKEGNKKLYKRDGNNREQELMKPETFLHHCKNPEFNSSSSLHLHLIVVSIVELTRT